jgi:hypothetical protein
MMSEFNTLSKKITDFLKEQLSLQNVVYLAYLRKAKSVGVELTEKAEHELFNAAGQVATSLQNDRQTMSIKFEYSEDDFVGKPTKEMLEQIQPDFDDFRQIGEMLKDITKRKFGETSKDIINDLASKMTDTWLTHAERVVAEEKQAHDSMKTGIQDSWGKPLFLLETLISSATHIFGYTYWLGVQQSSSYRS